MSQTVKKEDKNLEGQIAPATPVKEENLIQLSAEAQMKLAELVLNPPPLSPEIARMDALHSKIVRKSCD